MLFRQPNNPPPRPPGGISQQIQWLISHGLEVPDQGLAARCLNHIGWHRLSLYWQRFMGATAVGQATAFWGGVSFNDVMWQYMFDQRLRSLVLEGASYIEISIRTRWTDEIVNSSSRGDLGHQDAKLFDHKYYSGNLKRLKDEYERANKGGAPFANAKVQEVAEAMSFGQLSQWYENIRRGKIKQAIANSYSIDQWILVSSLRHLSRVRNLCAHHERLWDRSLTTMLVIPKNLGGNSNAKAWFNDKEQGKIYNALVMMAYLLDIITPNGDWSDRLISLVLWAKKEQMLEGDMGFPEGWEGLEIWRNRAPLGSTETTGTAAVLSRSVALG